MQGKIIWNSTTFLIIITVFSLLTLTSVTAFQGNTTESNFNHSSSSVPDFSNDGRYILLKTAQFNTQEDTSVASMASMESTSQSASDEYYIVQFKGYILEEWKQDVRNTGAVIVDYVPNNAFVMRMNASVKAEVEDLDSVQWIGPYFPSYRISPILSSVPEDAGQLDMIIMLFDPKDNERIMAEVDAIGGEIIGHAGDTIRVRIDYAKISEVAALNGVSWIEEYVHPVILNDVAAGIINVSYVQDTHGLTGNGQIVAVADTGLDIGVIDQSMHNDFDNRLIELIDLSDDGAADIYSGHGTHVAGSIVGNGYESGGQFKGMAPEAKLVFQAVENSDRSIRKADGSGGIPLDLSDLFQPAYDLNSTIHTNSWGAPVNGEYTVDSRNLDLFMWEHPDMLILFSAGNGGEDSDLDGVVDSNSIGSPGTAKNCLTVGASENDRGSNFNISPYVTYGYTWSSYFSVNPIKDDYMANDIEGIAAFSSRGPTDDGRIKPDVVAPGTFIISTRSSVATAQLWGDYDAYYRYSGGTSMSTPIVAGSAALVREHYVVNENIENPSAALIKATLINGAYDMTPGQYGSGVTQEIQMRPDAAQGWGRVDLEMSLFPKSPRKIYYNDTSSTISLNTAESWNITYYVANSSEPLKITLVWTDRPGAVSADFELVNNLDLIVSAPESTYLGNGGDQPDTLNNVEQVELLSPNAGWYTVTVNGTNIPQGPQPFAIVLSGAFGSDSTSPSSITGLSGSPGETWINWSWTNPLDPDFDHVELYLDGIFVMNTSSTSYNTTSLTADTVYELSTRTVDSVGNINSSWVNLSVSTDADTTAPSSITGLNGSPGETWINWSWTNPSDPDFDHVELYLDGIFVMNTSSTSYNTTGLTADTVYELSTRTVDSVGNINSSWVNLSVSTGADSTSPLSITGLSGSPGETWINWSWTNPLDPDFDHVELYLDGIFETNTSSTSYNTTGLTADTVYELSTRTVDSVGNINSNWVNLSVSTSTTKLDDSSSSSSSSGGGGGGGGSGSTGEAFENIAFKDVKTENIIGGLAISYVFDDEQNPIRYINFFAVRNYQRTSTTIEVLKNRSAMVDASAPGLVYSNFNIWVGKSGFATEDNIADPVIGFSVAKEWLSENGINENSIVLYRYSENRWHALNTGKIGEDVSFLYFEAETPGFSPFAIAADVEDVALTGDTVSTEEDYRILNVSSTVTIYEHSEEDDNVIGFEETTDSGSNMLFIAIVAGIVLILLSISYVLLSKGYHKK